MATNACVIHKTDTGCRAIYVHSDGYPEHTGAILQEKYNTDERVCELIDLGDLSFLDRDIESCKAYHRDVKENWQEVKPTEKQSLAEIAKVPKFQYACYFYVWEQGSWKTYKSRDFKNLLYQQIDNGGVECPIKESTQ